MRDNRWRYPHITANDDGAGPRIYDHLGRRTRRLDLDILQKADERYFLRRIDRRAHLDGRSVERHRHIWAKHLIHSIRHSHRGAEVRLMQVQQHIVGGLKRRIDHFLYRGTARDAADCRHIYDHRGSVIPFYAKSANDKIALRYSISLTVRAKHRCHQQRAAAKRFGAANRRNGDIQPLARLHEGRHFGRHHHRSDILRIQATGRRDQTELRDHRLQRLQRQAGGTVTSAGQTHNNAITYKLVRAHPGDRGHVLQPVCQHRRAGKAKEQAQKNKAFRHFCKCLSQHSLSSPIRRAIRCAWSG